LGPELNDDQLNVAARTAQARMNDPSSPLRNESQGASPVALSVGDDTREAWSCPLPNEIFTVGSQGRDEEIAGVCCVLRQGEREEAQRLNEID